MRLKDIDMFFEERRKNGTYVSIKFNEQTNNLLFEWAKKQKLGKVDLVKPDQYHCTILYSRQEIKKEHHLTGIIRSICKPLKLTVFPYEKNENCLVLELKNPTLNNLHQMFIDAGGTHDYDEYIPHVTICSGNDKDLNINNIDLPDFELITDLIKTEKLDLNWASK